MVKTSSTSTAGGSSSIPSWGTRIPYAVWHGQKKKRKKIKILNKKELKKKEILTPKDDSAGGVCFKRFLNPSRMGLQPHKRGFVEVSQPLLPCENRRSLKSGRGLSPNNANTITLDL